MKFISGGLVDCSQSIKPHHLMLCDSNDSKIRFRFGFVKVNVIAVTYPISSSMCILLVFSRRYDMQVTTQYSRYRFTLNT
jgi:hypothetical protein